MSPADVPSAGAGDREARLEPGIERAELRARSEAARVATAAAAARHLARESATRLRVEQSTAAIASSQAELAAIRSRIGEYAIALRELGVPPGPALVLVKRAVLGDAAADAPGASSTHQARRARDTLQGQLAAWFVDAYYAA